MKDTSGTSILFCHKGKLCVWNYLNEIKQTTLDRVEYVLWLQERGDHRV